MESFSSTSTSSSLFASTPFDKDSKLENKKSTSSAQFTDDPHYCGDKFPLFTFHDVKAPGLSTPFVETDSSVPKFWPDEPIPSLETLIPNVKQSRSTNWVNFLDESSSSATNLPSPGMPQSTKTVAEIWDAGQSHDDNDGWSAAFSPSLDSELSPQEFSPFHQPYACAWSTGSYQQDFYGMSTENGWTDAGSDPEAGFCYAANETSQYSSASQLNPYSEPWNASGLANQNPWSSTPSYHE